MGTSTQYVPFKHAGIVTDFPPEEVPPEFWTNARNVSFGDGLTQRTPGWSRYAADTMPAGKVPIFCIGINIGGSAVTSNFWVWCTANEVFITDGTQHIDITPAAGLANTDAGAWTGCTLNGVLVLNNPSNPPMYLDQLATPIIMKVLPGWPDNTACWAMRAVKYHLVALSIIVSGTGGATYPAKVWWSAAAVPGSIPAEWTPTDTNDAGDTDLADSLGAIVDAAPFRDQLIIFKNNATYTMQYVGGTFIYAFRRLFPNIGLQTSNCAVEMDGIQYMFTGEDVIAHDGQNMKSLVDRKVIKKFIASVDGARSYLCCVVARIVERQIWVCIPVAGQPWLSYALIINVDDGLVGSITLPNVGFVARGTTDPAGAIAQQSWDNRTGSWQTQNTIWTQNTFSQTNDSLMMVQPDANLLQAVGIGTSADGAAILSVVERLSMRIGDGIRHSVVTQLAPLIEAEAGIAFGIRLGTQNYYKDTITWSPFRTFITGDTRAENFTVDGRYISVWLQANTTLPWRLSGYYLKIKEAGEY